MTTRRISWTLGVCALLSACSSTHLVEPIDDGTPGAGATTRDDADARVVAGTGAAGSGATDDATGAADVRALLEGTDAEPLAACAGGASAAEVLDAIEIAYALDDSVHELVACGGMTTSMAVALVEGVVVLVADAGGSSLPGGFEFREGGTYYTATDTGIAQVEMGITLSIERDGERVRIEDNLFELESYLIGAEVSASLDVDFDIDDPFGASLDVEEPRIVYDEPGPWAFLLGLGDPPPNPIRVIDLPDLSPRLDELLVETSVRFSQERAGILVEYEVVTTPMPISDLLSGEPLSFEVMELRASHEALGQELVIDTQRFDLRYGSRALDGSVAFALADGPLSFAGVLHYEHGPYAEIELSCR